MAKKCPMCGASLKGTDVECQYCGTDVSTDSKGTTSVNYTESDDTFASESNATRTTYSKPRTYSKPFNTGLFILLIIFCSPLAILYVFAYAMDENNKHKK